MTYIANAQSLSTKLGGEWRGKLSFSLCPVCQSEWRTDQHGLSVRAEGGTLLACCLKHSCDFRDVEKVAGLPRDAMRVDPKAAREADIKREALAAEQLAKVRRLWATCKPLQGTKGESCLRWRVIACPLSPERSWTYDPYHGPNARWLSAMLPSRPLFRIASGRRAAAKGSHYVAAASQHLNNENCEMKQRILVPQNAGKALGAILGEPVMLKNRRAV
jgi:hypothetical protein